MPGNFTFVQYERTSYILYIFKKKNAKYHLPMHVQVHKCSCTDNTVSKDVAFCLLPKVAD